MLNDITAFILTQNNERTIKKCLESVLWCQEIVVIDSYSNDSTPEILQQYPQINLYQHQYTNAREQRIWGMSNVKTKWVFIIDSDEYCTEALRDKLIELVQGDGSEHDGYLIFTRTMFWGKLLKHQDYISSYGKRLVLTSVATRYKEDVRVHASIRLENKLKLNRNYYIVHDPISSLSCHMMKMCKYAHWQAEDMFDRRKRGFWWHLTLRPIGKFLKLYFINGGWKDGIRGLVVCLLAGWSVFLKFLYLKDMWQTSRD